MQIEFFLNFFQILRLLPGMGLLKSAYQLRHRRVTLNVLRYFLLQAMERPSCLIMHENLELETKN